MRLVSACLIVLSLFIGSCVVTRGEGEQLHSDIRRLKDELAKLQRNQFDSRHELDQNMREVQFRTSVLENTIFKKNAHSDLDKERLMTEVQQLRGRLEETQHKLENIKDEPQTHLQKNTQADKTKQIPKNKSDHFVYAKTLYEDHKHDDAVAALDEFIYKFRDDKQFLSQVYFMKGDAFFNKAMMLEFEAEKRTLFEKAVLAFQDVLTRFPKSSQVPESLYKVGSSLEQIGFPKDAQIFYKEVADKYPKSAFYTKARKKLAELTKKPK